MPSRQLACILCGLIAACLAAAAPASAASLLVLGDDGRARVVADPLPALPDLTAPRAAGSARASGDRTGVARAAQRRPSGRTVRGELRRMLEAGTIDALRHAELMEAYDDTRALSRRLPGRRGVELRAVVAMVDGVAARRLLDVTRLAPLWRTLEANAEWWREGPLLGSSQRVSFEGSQVVWQYVPGQGLQLHPLANFGRLNGFWLGGSRYRAQMEILLDELLELQVSRAGGVAWEYYFDFGPSRAPWVSGMAQGTAIQALTRAAQRLGRAEEVAPVVTQALAIFEAPPPAGVRVPSGRGAHYLLYSGDPGLRVLNGFAQALAGLQTVVAMTADARAAALYADGRAAIGAEIAASDTGAWSLYSLGRVSQESSLHYHQLLTEFLASLCRRTDDALYCESQARFAAYVRQPPELTVLTRRLRAGRSGLVSFRLSKRSYVTARIEHRGRVVAQRALGTLPYGRRALALTPPRRRRGEYVVTLSGTDLAGNPNATTAVVGILPARRARRGGS